MDTIPLIFHSRDKKQSCRGVGSGGGEETGCFAQGCIGSGWQNLDQTQLI